MGKKKKQVKKLYVCQPTRGYSIDDRLLIKQNIIENVKKSHPDVDIEVVNPNLSEVFTFSDEEGSGEKVKSLSIYLLSEQVRLLSKADIVYIAVGWETSSECMILRAISRAYQVPEVIEEYTDEDNDVNVNTYITPTYDDEI